MKASASLFPLLLPLLLVAGLALPAAANASPLPENSAPIYRYRLANGLRLWVQPRAGSHSALAMLIIKAGSRYETADNNGISHFVEHMVFTGTARRTEKEIKDIITTRGGEWNGGTGLEETSFYAHVAGSDVDLALDWLADTVFHATFPSDKVDKERQMIFQERGGRYSAILNKIEDLGFGYDLDRRVRRALFPASQLDLIVSGQDGTLERIDRAALLTYYQERYTAANSNLIVVGDVDPAQVEAMVRAYFGGLPERPLPAGLPAPQPSAGPWDIVVRGPTINDQVRLMTGVRTVPWNHPDRWALDVLGQALSRDLNDKIRYQRGFTYGVSSFNSSYADAGYFIISVSSDIGHEQEIRTIVEDELAGLLSRGLSAERIAEAKASLIGSWALGSENNYRWAGWLGAWAEVLNDDDPVPDYEALIGAVTPDDVTQVAASYFQPENRYVGLHQPVVTLPGGGRVAAGVAGVALGVFAGVRVVRRRRTLAPHGQA